MRGAPAIFGKNVKKQEGLEMTEKGTFVIRACITAAAVLVICPALMGDEPGRPSSDGSIYSQDFEAIEPGGLPEEWESYVQTTNGTAHGHAEVSGSFERRSFRLSDGQAFVAAWSVSDEIFPEEGNWAVQFDMRLAGPLIYGLAAGGAPGAGAVFGLKRGRRGAAAPFLPVIALDGRGRDGGQVALLGLGEVIDADVPANAWHRIVFRREGTAWKFYLNGELKRTVTGVDTDLRGYAFGSFRDWRHMARDVYIDNFKIGRFAE